VVHPKAPPQLIGAERKKGHPPPGPYDINGGAMWNNKADLGITIHSPEHGLADVICWKARFRRFGRKGTTARLAFDPLTGRYSDPAGATETTAGDDE
jgi:hypothetical protein